MTSIIEKRLSLYKHLENEQQQNEELKEQVTRLQGLANIGTVTCMIAHEINNLLTPLTSYAALALNNLDDAALVAKAFEKTVRNCRRASDMMDSMLALAGGEIKHKQTVQLKNLVEEVFACLCRDFSKDGITVRIEIPDDLTLWVVPVQIQHVLLNLIINAREAMLPGGGILTIRALRGDDGVGIEVSDTGCGIPAEHIEKIFEPFFTTKVEKKSGEGAASAGLGLALAKRIIDAHDGSISVRSKQAEGTVFTIKLPQSHMGKRS